MLAESEFRIWERYVLLYLQYNGALVSEFLSGIYS